MATESSHWTLNSLNLQGDRPITLGHSDCPRFSTESPVPGNPTVQSKLKQSSASLLSQKGMGERGPADAYCGWAELLLRVRSPCNRALKPPPQRCETGEGPTASWCPRQNLGVAEPQALGL